MSKTILTARDRKLLAQRKKVMEEVFETQEILADQQLMESIDGSRKDLKSGRTVEWEQLKRELRSKNKL